MDQTEGWFFTFTHASGDRYGMFAYWDGTGYQVKVVIPEVEERCDLHKVHLQPDGRIHPGWAHPRGMSSLEAAYAMSVQWACGFSSFLVTGTFPWQDPDTPV